MWTFTKNVLLIIPEIAPILLAVIYIEYCTNLSRKSYKTFSRATLVISECSAGVFYFRRLSVFIKDFCQKITKWFWTEISLDIDLHWKLFIGISAVIKSVKLLEEPCMLEDNIGEFTKESLRIFIRDSLRSNHWKISEELLNVSLGKNPGWILKHIVNKNVGGISWEIHVRINWWIPKKVFGVISGGNIGQIAEWILMRFLEKIMKWYTWGNTWHNVARNPKSGHRSTA